VPDEGCPRTKEWLETTVKMMVDRPDEARVEEGVSPDGSTVFYSIFVNYDHDLGKVVGRGGRNIESLRKIGGAITLARYNRRCEITAFDPTKQRRRGSG
jgi:predicted RNA-binding protein YlqC (UPF0109 family)